MHGSEGREGAISKTSSFTRPLSPSSYRVVEKLKTSILQRYLWECDRPPNREVKSVKINTSSEQSQSVIDTSERCRSTTLSVSPQSPKRCQGAIAIQLRLSEP